MALEISIRPDAGQRQRPVLVGAGVLACLALMMFVEAARTPAVADEPQRRKSPAIAAPADSAARLRGAVLLIEVEKAGRFWPFATCCAVGENTVLTSAREALKLGAWIAHSKTGFKGWVANPATGLKLPVRDARIYAVPASAAPKPKDWLYTDLGLVTVQGKLPKTVALASPGELAQLAPGKVVYDYAYVHEGDVIAPEDRLDLRRTPAKILFLDVRPDLRGKPCVLEVQAALPKYPLGGPLVNAEGKVVAVYSAPVAKPAGKPKGGSQAAKNLHFATLINRGAIGSWLNGSDRSCWVPAAELKVLRKRSDRR